MSYYSGYQYCYSEAQKQQYFPEAIEGEICHVVDTTNAKYLRMNWGNGGQNDDAYYSLANNDSWPQLWSGNHYPYNPWISYGYWQDGEE